MRHTAKLTIAAFALLGAMTVGAFAASSRGAQPPRAVDLPQIVTALTIPSAATSASPASVVAPAPAARSSVRPPSPAAKSATPPAALASPGSSKNPPGDATPRNDHARGPAGGDHEVVSPPLHESDGHSGGEQGHNSGR